MTLSFWGGDVYWYGIPSTANITITANGKVTPDKAENRLIAYTGGYALLGYNVVTFTLNSGFVNITQINIRYYTYMANM